VKDGSNSVQFHYTKTEDDGIRLGCYGHELDGRKYSTHYVADMNGYRSVRPNGVIAVYPRSGAASKAALYDEFDAKEQKKQNIKYAFPERCSGENMDFIPLESAPPPVIEPKEMIERCQNDAEAVPKLLLPIALKETKNTDGHKTYAKLTLPIDSLSVETLTIIRNNIHNRSADSTEVLKSILIKLL